MDSSIREIIHTVRALLRRPVYTASAVLTLAIGLGSTIAVYTLIDSILLRPFPFPQSDRIVSLWYDVPSPAGPTRARQSEATYLTLRDHGTAFRAVGLAEPRTMTVTDGDRPTRVEGALVTSTLFGVLQVPVALGRPLSPEDDLPGAEPVVVLSDALWATQFGADPAVVGRTLEIDGVHHRVVGVLPGWVRFPEQTTALWVPHRIDVADPAQMVFFYRGYGRLSAGTSLETAYDDIDRLIHLIPDLYPSFPRAVVETGAIKPILVPIVEAVAGDIRRPLWMVFAAVIVVLVVGASNVANLMLVRTQGRARELAIRGALGASRRRLTLLVMTESVVLAGVGGAIGLAAATAGVSAVRASGWEALPRLSEVEIRGSVVLLAAMLAIAVGVALGGLMVVGKRFEASALRAGGRSVGLSHRGRRVGAVLVSGQLALALVLLAGSGLLLRSLLEIRDIRPGFEADNVAAFRIAVSEAEYPTMIDRRAYFRRVTEAAAAVPGVRRVGLANHLPLRDGRLFLSFEAEGQRYDPTEVVPTFLTKTVAGEYFRTMGIPLRAGRGLQPGDEERTDDLPIVVNARFAERFWPGADPLGRRLRTEQGGPWLTVVGVAGNVRDRSLTEPPSGIVYLPMVAQSLATGLHGREMTLAFVADNPQAAVPLVRAAVQRVDAGVPLYDVRTMDRVVADAAAPARSVAVLLGATAVSALFLAAVGIYGVLAYSVSQRRGELGVRIALGADGQAVRRLVVGDAVRIAGVGAGVGLVAALGASRLLVGFLHDVSPADPVTLVAVTAVLIVTSVVAAAIPARRAAGTDPVLALQGVE